MKCPLHFLWANKSKISYLKIASILFLLFLLLINTCFITFALQKHFKVLVSIAIIMWLISHFKGKFNV